MRMRANDAHASSQLPELCLHRACASQDADAARTEKEPGHHLCARMCVSMLAAKTPKVKAPDTFLIFSLSWQCYTSLGHPRAF